MYFHLSLSTSFFAARVLSDWRVCDISKHFSLHMVSAYFALALFTIVQICIKSLEYRILNLVVYFRLSSLAAKVSLPFFTILHSYIHSRLQGIIPYLRTSRLFTLCHYPITYLVWVVAGYHISSTLLALTLFSRQRSQLHRHLALI